MVLELLTEETITFGKYNGLSLNKMIRDRKYCEWLLQPEQKWFKEKYEFLFNRIKDYNPQKTFLKHKTLQVGLVSSANEFCELYEYFNLIPIEKISPDNLQLETDSICYKYYFNILTSIKSQLLQNIENQIDNPYDIKTPSKWLIKFEQETSLQRDVFKEFIDAYELLNITSIIERIKKEGGLQFNGAKSFIIAKERSVKQEKWWEEKLKQKYSQDIGVQFKYEKCIFDFIHINSNTLYECKLSFKDFSNKQYQKYLHTLEKYKIVYLIGYDTIVSFENKKIYTTSFPLIFDSNTEFMKFITTFDIINVNNLDEYL